MTQPCAVRFRKKHPEVHVRMPDLEETTAQVANDPTHPNSGAVIEWLLAEVVDMRKT
jgi:hypothetical protein